MKTLYRQFIVAILVILMCSLIFALFIANLFYTNVTKKDSDEEHVVITQEVAHVLENMHDGGGFSEYLDSISKLGYQIAVVSEQDTIQFYGEPFEKTTLSPDATNVLEKQEIFHGMRQFSSQVFMMSHFTNDINNTVGVPFTLNNEQYALFLRSNTKLLSSDIHTLLLGFVLTIAVASILGVVWLARQLTRPIAQLTEATKQLANENYSYELNIKRQDEIGQLAESFNEMQRQLQHNDLARKSFISNVSHDFQSPLMNIQGYADLLRSPAVTEEERTEYVSVIDQESKRLSSLTKQLLLLTSLDQPSYPMKYEEFRLDEQLKEIIMKFYWRLEEANLDISYHLPEVTIRADKELLTNVWENLLSNAIKYNRLNGSIEISLLETVDTIVVTMKDTGIGISGDAQPQLFDRFFRVDDARKRDGTGLGLSIVKQIVTLHNGTVIVTSTVNEGTVFKITLKK